MGSAVLALASLTPACSAGVPAAKHEPDPSRVLVRIEFEPPLLAPGVLHYAHECGESGAVTTACTGVDLELPPGPVTFRLRAAGGDAELAARVAVGMAPTVWNWRR